MERVGFLGIFEESRRIISAHSRHFLGLSVLFLLPIAVLTCAASTFRNWIENKEVHEELLSSVRPDYNHPKGVQDFLTFSLSGHSNTKEIKVIILLTIYALVIFGLALCSNAAVTHSICNGFFGRGVKLPSAIKSVPGSVWRLSLTAACALAALVGMSVVFGLLLSLSILMLSAFNVQLTSLTPVYIAMGVLVGLVAINLQIQWIHASVIPVVEGSWGLEPLRRSAYLVKGMRLVAFILTLFFGLCGLVLVLWANYLQSSASGSVDLLSKIVQSITVLAGMTVLFLYNIATNTVFYMYCKAYHNELLGAIVEEFAQEYMSLPFDDQKIPQVVTIAEP